MSSFNRVCPLADLGRRDVTKRCQGAGFTLVELLLVMSLLGLMAGLALPRFSGWLDAAQLRASEGAVREALEALPSRAFFSGEQLVLTEALGAGALPHGWYLRSETPIRYQANGMTNGGRVQLMAGDMVQAEFFIAAPAGQVRRLSQP